MVKLFLQKSYWRSSQFSGATEYQTVFLLKKSWMWKVIRIPVSDIRIIGRNTKGVKVVNLDEGDKVERVERIVNESEDVE